MQTEDLVRGNNSATKAGTRLRDPSSKDCGQIKASGNVSHRLRKAKDKTHHLALFAHRIPKEKAVPASEMDAGSPGMGPPAGPVGYLASGLYPWGLCRLPMPVLGPVLVPKPGTASGFPVKVDNDIRTTSRGDTHVFSPTCGVPVESPSNFFLRDIITAVHLSPTLCSPIPSNWLQTDHPVRSSQSHLALLAW
jgi:hypothetical protein